MSSSTSRPRCTWPVAGVRGIAATSTNRRGCLKRARRPSQWDRTSSGCGIGQPGAVTTTAHDATELVLHPGGQPITVSGEHLAAGAEVQLAVRPEAIELSTLSKATGLNAYKAELRSASFLGDHYLYELDIDGMPLTVTDTRSIPGPSVTVRIPPAACRVLPP